MDYNNSVVFQKTDSIEVVANYLKSVLLEQLGMAKKVLWLVPGGSAIAVTAAVSRLLAGHQLEGLTVGLTDERFGDVGHADSNWQQMSQAGIYFAKATLLPALNGADQATTTTAYATSLSQAFAKADYKLGLFGMGADGHTAGILPGSPAVTDGQWAVSYQADPFIRLTMTPKAIRHLDEAVLYAMGQAKQTALHNLKSSLTLAEQPAQALKAATKLTVFNDQIGE